MSEVLASSRNLKSDRFGFQLLGQKYVWLAMIPLIVAVMYFGYRGLHQWQADQANQQQIEEWAQAGIPYDNASLQKSYLGRTHPEGYADWARALRLSEWGYRIDTFTRLPMIGGEGELPTVLIPDANIDQWKDNALVASYLKEMQTVVDLVERASSHPTPVQFPMHFQGFGTLLPHIQSCRSIARLLALDCEYAYSQNETQRALRDLSLMGPTAEAFDSHDVLVGELVIAAVRGIKFRTVRRTLTHCAWDEPQLEALRELLPPERDITARWRQAITFERAMALASLGTPGFDLLPGYESRIMGPTKQNRKIQPSDIQLVREYYNELIDAAAGDSILQWKKKVAEIEIRLNNEDPKSIAAMILPATAQVSDARIHVEHTRRWTLTAVALRHYHQQNGNWPKKLSDLSTVGLVFDDYSNLNGEMFGYEVDGQTAYLWKGNEYDWEKNHISPTRPTEQEDSEQAKKEQLDSYLLELN